MSPKKATGSSVDAKSKHKPGKGATGQAGQGFTQEERQAMKERAEELQAEKRRGRGAGGNKAEGEADIQAKIAQMPEPDRTMAQRVHTLVMAAAPDLVPRTWYGMPAYAKDGNVICFFQSGAKFKARYATLGFSDQAHLDDGAMWPTAFALKELTVAQEATITALVQKAVG